VTTAEIARQVDRKIEAESLAPDDDVAGQPAQAELREQRPGESERDQRQPGDDEPLRHIAFHLQVRLGRILPK
jgi:hypothetical protein